MKTIFILISILFLNPSSLFSQAGWVQQNIPNSTSGALTDIQFINETTGWACGQFGLLFKTTNGGDVWIGIPNEGHYTDINFVNENTGFLAAYGMIKKSTDGGNTWSVSTFLPDNSVAQSMSFINENTGWVCGKGIFKTTNAGNNWIHYSIPNYEHFNLYSISFPTLNTGYCSGYYINPFNGEYSCILLKSTNGGTTWQVLLEQTDNSFYDVQFFDENTGYVNGLPPLKTIDGGLTWESILDSSGYYILAMHFIDPDIGWFGSSNGTVYTNDGGKTWQAQSLSVQSNVHGISFINNNTGWCVGMNNISYPRIFKTTTGGLTFIQTGGNSIPAEYSLHQNYPNPFNPVTNLEFGISKLGFVSLKVYDMLGKEIATLVNENLNPGTYKYNFDASDLTSGIYFYKLESEGFQETKRMMLIK